MTKPTGRPRGRPKTKEYVTLMARFPQELAEQVERYAGRKRQTISEVLRDGALVLLQDDEDAYRPFVSDRKAASDILSDTKAEEEEPPEVPPLIVSDINTEIAPAAEEATEIVYDVKKARQRKRAQPDNVSDKKAEAKAAVAPDGETAIMSDKKRAPAKKKQAKQPARRVKRG